MLDNLVKYNIILASKSPRRKQLMNEMGLQFNIVSSTFDESSITGYQPDETAKLIAENKANDFIHTIKQNELIIAADTIVVLNDEIIGKPKDVIDAKRMLSKLSGKKHEVITGVCLLSSDKKIVFSNSTFVYFKRLSDSEINQYVDEFKPLDKAGAYGIQEWLGTIAITKIEGSYHNVMGLPTQELYKHLQSFNLNE